MTTLVPAADFPAFIATHRVEGLAWKKGLGWEIRWTEPCVLTDEQQQFDRAEMSQPPKFSWDFPYVRRVKKVSGKKVGQWELGL